MIHTFNNSMEKEADTPTPKAPKARLIPAWGEAPGMATPNFQGLKARPISPSVPHIPLIKFDPVFLQKRAKFILKRQLPVMRLLRIDVTNQRIQIHRPNGERPIASLPSELRQSRRLRLEPFGRRRFQLFHQLRHAQRARKTNGKVNVVRNTPHAKAFAFSITGNRGEVGMKRGTHRIIKNGSAIFGAKDHMDKEKRKRLGHRQNYKSGLQPSRMSGNGTWGYAPGWYSVAPLALFLTLALSTSGCAQMPSSPEKPVPATHHTIPSRPITKAEPPTITIKIINAKTNKPIHDERLNVALKEDQIGSVAMPTDKNGIIEVKTGDATIIRILSNMYADCRPRAELYTSYSIAEIHTNGIATGNLCSDAHPKANPGELILFEIPKTYVPKNPEPPITHLPHSDEYPN